MSDQLMCNAPLIIICQKELFTLDFECVQTLVEPVIIDFIIYGDLQLIPEVDHPPHKEVPYPITNGDNNLGTQVVVVLFDPIRYINILDWTKRHEIKPKQHQWRLL